MQTFLPHADFKQTAHDLDYKRLGKQRVEAWQILDAIKRKKSGQTKGAWLNHPCITIWYNHEVALIEYSIEICKAWIDRGYRDTMLPRFEQQLDEYLMAGFDSTRPRLVGDERFHVSHKSNLIRKLPEFYQPLYPNVSPDIPYFWSSDLAQA